MIIDPGPRTVRRPGERAEFSRNTIPKDYPHGAFPPIDPEHPRVPYEIDTLGDVMMAPQRPAARPRRLRQSRRADSDRDLYRRRHLVRRHRRWSGVCRLKLKGQEEPIVLTAWALVGSPKYAPELRSISTLDDIAFDVGTYPRTGHALGEVTGLASILHYEPSR